MLTYLIITLFVILLAGTVFIKANDKAVLTAGAQEPTNVTPPTHQLFSLRSNVRITRYISIYRCDSCHYETTEKQEYCPECVKKGKKKPMTVYLNKMASR